MDERIGTPALNKSQPKSMGVALSTLPSLEVIRVLLAVALKMHRENISNNQILA
jgi:hypothetical protein